MMSKITNEFLELNRGMILDASGVRFECFLKNIPMDQVIVDFSEYGVGNAIASEYICKERVNFFVNRWRQIIYFLLRVKIIELNLYGSVDLWLDDIAYNSGLVFTSSGIKNQLSIPDPIFIESRGYESIRSFSSSEKNIPWKNRRPLVFWRGVTTGIRQSDRIGIFSLPRIYLCDLILKSGYEKLFDVGITDIVQIEDENEISLIKNGNFIKNKVAQEYFGNYKFSIDIDGNSNSWPGLFTKLLLGVTVIKISSTSGFSQWYYDKLVPWVHYVPVKSDMSDLIEKVLWVNDHEREAEIIADNGKKLAFSITMESEILSVSKKLKNFLQENPCQLRLPINNRCIGHKSMDNSENNTRPLAPDASLAPPKLDANADEPTIEANVTEQEAVNPTRRKMVQALWQGCDPFAGFPATLYLVDSQGWNSGHRYLGEAISELKPALVVEIGVWKGGSTMTLASALKALGSDGVVLAVDTWLGSSEHWIQPEWTAHLAIVHGYPQFFYKFMANVMAAGLQSHILPLPLDSLNAARLLELRGSAIDLIHLDAGHDYRSVSGDLEAWWPLLRPGGILIGDDYNRDGAWPEVRQAFDDFFGRRSISFVDAEAKCLIRKPL